MFDVSVDHVPSEIASESVALPASKLGVYLSGLVDELIELTPRALVDGDADAIHATRVATRRLKAAMDLVEPVVSKEHARPFGRTLKKLRRSLGDLRDLDVMGGHLTALARRRRTLVAAVQWLQMQLNAERVAARRDSEDRTPPSKFIGRLSSWWSIRAEIDDSAGALDAMLGQSLHLQLDAFAEQADQVVVQFGAGSAEIGETGEGPGEADGRDIQLPELRHDPHELRISGKALRYTLEMAREQGHDMPGKVFKAFKALQEHLGLWHDFVVLADWSVQAALEKQLSHHDPVASGAVLDVAKVCLKKCGVELQAFGKLWTTRGDEIVTSIRHAFPLTRAATVVGPETTGERASVRGNLV